MATKDVLAAELPPDEGRAQHAGEQADERACRVQLDVFDGPLDLLLSLIKEQQLDIATVPLASVASQYLSYVRLM
ncbi:MAG TPA: hypothetical protein VMW12_05780, partial [Candidatus Dormibacteraeota bacterium]|nr:hypothetical protein [Candidatus Dormibacteraeota bacterium]